MRYDIEIEVKKAFFKRVQINRYYRNQVESMMFFSRESTLNRGITGVNLFFKGETL